MECSGVRNGREESCEGEKGGEGEEKGKMQLEDVGEEEQDGDDNEK